MNLLLPFLGNAEHWSGRTAIVAPGSRSTSFGDLARRSARMAAAWRQAGIEAGDRVLVAMPLGIELYAAIAGLWRLGAVVVFPEPAFGLKGLRQAAAVTTPKAYLSAGWYGALRLVVPEIRRIPLHLDIGGGVGGNDACFAASAEHPALISFTSGSTGAPKGIVRSHGFLAAQNECIARFLAPGSYGAVDLVAFPVFVIVNLGLGVTSVLPMRERSAEALFAWLTGNRVTRILAPPSLCEIIVANSSPPDLSTVFTGGGPVFPDLLSKLCERLPKAEIVTVYGSTEAEPIAHQTAADLSAPDWQAMRSGAGLVAGLPVAGLQMRLMDDEIVVTGAHVNKGYLGGLGDAENKPIIDGEVWHRTGDAGRLDDRGRLWLLGRHGAAAGGLYPFQVEAAARLWPGVRRVALIPGSMPPLLAIEGDAAQATLWRREARRFDGLRIVETNVPLDRRHHSKVDYVELERRIGKLRQVN